MSLQTEVQTVIDTVRPMLQNDGGDVELLGVSDDGTVKVRLQGACGSCQFAAMTLKNGIEARLKELVPAVKEVVAL
ncbi:NifU family protein [Deferribacterales bacterium RsTz2092]|nr:NifU family protein [Deferribacterales bacterium]